MVVAYLRKILFILVFQIDRDTIRVGKHFEMKKINVRVGVETKRSKKEKKKRRNQKKNRGQRHVREKDEEFFFLVVFVRYQFDFELKNMFENGKFLYEDLFRIDFVIFFKIFCCFHHPFSLACGEPSSALSSPGRCSRRACCRPASSCHRRRSVGPSP